jgi:molybdate transport system ATP-binding protein
LSLPSSPELRVVANVTRAGGGPESGHPGFTLDVDITFRDGITCVLGPSGAGKSTILAVVAGLVDPTRGKVSLGDDVWVDTERRIDVPVHLRRVAYLFQSLALFPHLNALNNVLYPLRGKGTSQEQVARADALLEKVGVTHLRLRRPRTFSGGEAQRVALARALAMTPRVLLLDEPFSALDREIKVPLMRLVRQLADETRIPVIAVTHSIGETRALADRVIRIAGGRVVADGTVDSVLPREHADENRFLENTPAPVLTRR